MFCEEGFCQLIHVIQKVSLVQTMKSFQVSVCENFSFFPHHLLLAHWN